LATRFASHPARVYLVRAVATNNPLSVLARPVPTVLRRFFLRFRAAIRVKAMAGVVRKVKYAGNKIAGIHPVVELAHDFVINRPFTLAYCDILVDPVN
jgi:hypothetical protein